MGDICVCQFRENKEYGFVENEEEVTYYNRTDTRLACEMKQRHRHTLPSLSV